MPVMTVGTGRALIPTGINYNDLVMGTQPIAYWPQSESSGLVARCLTNPAMNGTYTGVTLANDNTGPFGTPAPFYDGANDYCSLLTAALQAAWNAGGAEWSIMAWWKVFNVGVWTDTLDRKLFNFSGDVNHNASSTKAGAANTWIDLLTAGGVAHLDIRGGQTSIDWNNLVITRSEIANEIRYYVNGVWVATDAAIGVWAMAGAWGAMLIGALSVVPQQVWHGWIGPVGHWPRALPQATITTLANP